MRTFQAAAVQFHAGADKAANLAKAEAAIGLAAADGAQLVALPEVFSWRGRQADEAGAAESIPGPTFEACAAMAANHRVHLVAGSILETSARSRVYNTCVLFGPDGEALAKYRKIHLFDVDIPGEVTIAESESRLAGDEPVCVETELGRIGLAVCYDLRFPELFRRLVADGKPADVIVMPSAFTRTTGRAHWEPLLRARAIENQCFFVAPNQCGKAAQGFLDHGTSLIVDPWGEILAAAAADTDDIVHATLDAQRLADVRQRLPALTHRKLSP